MALEYRRDRPSTLKPGCDDDGDAALRSRARPTAPSISGRSRSTPYGLLLAIGVIVATRSPRSAGCKRGNDRDSSPTLVVWVVIGGVVGARVYHVFTDYDWDRRRHRRHGQDLGGRALDLGRARRRRDRVGGRWRGVKHLETLVLMDCIAPGLLAAQASGAGATGSTRSCSASPPTFRGGSRSTRPTARREYLDDETFHPTFLYESLYCLLDPRLLLLAERRFRFRKGQTVALYLVMYTFGRFFFENLRIDPSQKVLRPARQRLGERARLRRQRGVVRVVGAQRQALSRRRPRPRSATVRPRPPDRSRGVVRDPATARVPYGMAPMSVARPAPAGRRDPHRRPRRRRRRRSTAAAKRRCARSTASTSTSRPAGSPRSWARRDRASRRCLHCLAGLDRVTSGRVFLGDIEISAASEKELTLVRRDQIGFVFQAYNLIPTLERDREHRPAAGAGRTASPTTRGSTR